ncbi:hypothetical protein [Streptomyces sp. NRRL S-920]|uniref:hypothetical protein n=1 Tax=Streptomyces sp. NRRL S-920 TaxID=1463921 RepID=UPI0004C923AB|nr:hypothetical protein [Streptomyces sp. NRRL S-920]
MRPTPKVLVLAAAAALSVASCGGDGDAGKNPKEPTRAESPTAKPEAPALGTTAHTAGAAHPLGGGGGGMLDITPSTIAYVTKGTGQTPEEEVFAVVAYKAKSTRGVAASETVPAEAKGWQWIAPDGETAENNGFSAPSVNAKGFTNAGPIQPDSFQWRSQVFDITEAQRGGTLVYTDGEGQTYRWKMPAKDAGPELAKLKAGLK